MAQGGGHLSPCFSERRPHASNLELFVPTTTTGEEAAIMRERPSSLLREFRPRKPYFLSALFAPPTAVRGSELNVRAVCTPRPTPTAERTVANPRGSLTHYYTSSFTRPKDSRQAA